MEKEPMHRYRLPEKVKARQMESIRKKFENYSGKHAVGLRNGKKEHGSKKGEIRFAVIGLVLIAWLAWRFLRR